jgi:hypothetical protein
MKPPHNQATMQPQPHIPGLTRRMVRDHAARLFRDVFSVRPLTAPEWRLAENDLARKLERDGF